METFYIIVGTKPNIINTTKTDKKRTPITLYNYTYICKFIYENNQIIMDDNITKYYSVYSELKTINNKWRVNMFQVTTNGTNKQLINVKLSEQLTDKIILMLLNNEKYKQYISSITDINYSDIFRFIESDYLIRYTQKHDNIFMTVNYDNNMNQQPNIILSNVCGIRKDFKKSYRMFPNVMTSTKYVVNKKMRDNVKFKHTVAKEILYKLFDKLLTMDSGSLILGDYDTSPFEIIDVEHKYMLFGQIFVL